MSAAWSESQEFLAAFTSLSMKLFPTKTVFEVPEKKCEALRYHRGRKHLLTAYRAVCFAINFWASVELSSGTFCRYSLRFNSKSPRRSQNTAAIILRFDSFCLALTMTEEDVRHTNSIDCCFDSRVIWDTHVSYPVIIRLNMSSPSSS
ncbi:hypothetical protein TNCV_3587141 [Trichonephila clavipes]|nr:hypothetical protein TNCV_3587141 [Trichonephila clavipes]